MANNQPINGGNGNDTLSGNNGNDTIYGNGGNDTIYGGDGDDKLYGGAGEDSIYGGAGNDYIVGGSDKDYLDGGSGIDTVDYSYFNGTGTYNLATGITSSPGSYDEQMLNFENIITGGGNDTVIGTTGNNRIETGAGDDTVYGGDGDDTIYGGAGEDKLYGGAGNDYIVGGSNKDFLDGGSGIDTVDYSYFNGEGTYNLATGVSSSPGSYDEQILNFENIITGGGNDTVTGTAGNNRIETGAGDDKLKGGAGDDYLSGGSGKDSFYFGDSTRPSSSITLAALLGKDTIADFTSGQDKIVLNKSTFASIRSAGGPMDRLTGANFLTVANDNAALTSNSAAAILYSSSTGNLFYNQDGATVGLGGTNGGNFATITGKPVLTASDFSIIG
jgi:Ca2+-binding RTX toxin-like protein